MGVLRRPALVEGDRGRTVADIKVAVDKTTAWEKREAYSQTEVPGLERCGEGTTYLIVLLGAHAGLRVSEMTALRWEHLDLADGSKVVAGKGSRSARVYLTPTLTEALGAVTAEQRNGHVLALPFVAVGVRTLRSRL